MRVTDDKWSMLANEQSIRNASDALQRNGIEVFVFENSEQAKEKVLELVPEGSEVFTNSSTTLEQTGIMKEIDESGRYVSVRKKVSGMNDPKKRHETRRMSSTADYVVGSVHAVTEDGKLFIASNTGSQLPSLASSASHVILVVGTQKIVKDFDSALKRLYEYTLPLESERLKKIYGVPSNVSKLLIINKEIVQGRIKLIFIKENLGF